MTHHAETERLRLAWKALTARAVPTDSCPDAERLWESARGDLGPRKNREILSHTATCPACAEAWDMAVAGAAAEGSRPELLHPAPSPGWRSWAPVASVAAMLLVVVGILQLGPSGDRLAQRDSSHGELVSLLPEGGRLPRSEPVLRWSYPGDEHRFDLYLRWLSPDGPVTIGEAEGLSVAEYRIPPEQLGSLPSGATLYWRVEVVDRGSIVANRTFKTTIE